MLLVSLVILESLQVGLINGKKNVLCDPCAVWVRSCILGSRQGPSDLTGR